MMRLFLLAVILLILSSFVISYIYRWLRVFSAGGLLGERLLYGLGRQIDIFSHLKLCLTVIHNLR